jgi:hypothetical protein
MRAVVLGAFALALVGSSGLGRGSPQPPLAPALPHDQTCEEQCQSERARDDAACEDRALGDGQRGFCHQAVRARLDVCLRICDD